ncbi:hypothetical protein BG61_10070 [Caballeronia glathei]|uniref:Uncharacterized protein n=1 Tax=Caballeronia glathei TaxID=60547 RepID=A0A069PAI6_9BURK|nr:hypothetical protein BG61_10070 [Caballeronia glathei]
MFETLLALHDEQLATTPRHKVIEAEHQLRHFLAGTRRRQYSSRAQVTARAIGSAQLYRAPPRGLRRYAPHIWPVCRAPARASCAREEERRPSVRDSNL